MASANSEKSEGNRLAENAEATPREEQDSGAPMTHWAT